MQSNDYRGIDFMIFFIQIFFALSIVVLMIYLMVKRKSSASVSLIWIGMALVIIFFAAFPQILNYVCTLLKIDYQPVLPLSLLLVALFAVCFYLSSEIAVLQTKIRELSIHISLLNNEVHNIKNNSKTDRGA